MTIPLARPRETPAGCDAQQRLVDAQAVAASMTEPERFGEVFDRHAVAVHRYLARRVGSDTADELLSEVFLVAFRSREGFDADRGGVLSWLFGIATNLARRRQRDEARQYQAYARAAFAVESLPDFTGCHADTVADRVDAAAGTAALAHALAALAEGDRDALLLHVWGGLPYSEVACALDIPTGTVCSRIFRARASLRAALPASFLPLESDLS